MIGKVGMNNSHSSWYLEKYSFLLLLCFSTSTVSAAECFSPVPGLEQGEIYDHQPIVATRLSSAEHRTLKELLGSIEGTWQGDAQEEFCLGKPGAARKKIKEYVLNAEAEANSNGGLKVLLDFESVENRSNHQESFNFYLSQDWLRVGADSSKGNTELIELYSESVSFVQSHYLRGNIPQNVVTKVSNSAGEFRVTRYFYNHGQLSSISRWILRN